MFMEIYPRESYQEYNYSDFQIIYDVTIFKLLIFVDLQKIRLCKCFVVVDVFHV